MLLSFTSNAFIVLKNIFKKFSLQEVSYPYSLLIKIMLNCNVMQLEMHLEVHLKLDLKSNSILHISLENEVNCNNES